MIFMAVYIQKPDLAGDLPSLFTYWWEIRSIADQGGDFMFYDSEFRQERQTLAEMGLEPWDWGIFRQDLFNRAFRRISVVNAQKQYSVSRSSSVPKGFCFAFHAYGQRCEKGQNCTYKHACPCGRGIHTMYTCKTSGKPAGKRAAQDSTTGTGGGATNTN